MIDAIACERQFLDHLAPVWRALPEALRGRFVVDASLLERAAYRGITAEPLDADTIRRTPQRGPVHDGTPTLVASIGDIKVARRLGHGPFAFLEHGAGQSYGQHNPAGASYAGGPDRADNELFLVPNEYSASLWRGAYPAARVEVVGCPRLDDLPTRVPDGKMTVAISFHGDWPHAVPYGGNALGDFLPVLPELAKTFNVIGHAHPGKMWGKRMARLFSRAGIPFVEEFDDVCRQADVYVCDNSSTIFEFAATGRPVVVLNAAHWAPGHGPGGRFWDWAPVGLNVWTRDDLIPTVERALEERQEDAAAREAALGLVYPGRHGGAQLAATAIAEWAATRVGVAA